MLPACFVIVFGLFTFPLPLLEIRGGGGGGGAEEANQGGGGGWGDFDVVVVAST